MTLHRLASITVGVPDPTPVGEYYTEFGLTREEDGVLSTTEGGRQLFLEEAATRRLVSMVISVDGEEDLTRISALASAAGLSVGSDDGELEVVEPETNVRVVLQIAPRIKANPVPAVSFNTPGQSVRRGERAPGVLRHDRVRPRKLGHVVLTTTNFAASSAFFTDVLGFKVSDYIGEVGVFLRCSTDHHNLLLLAAPVVYLHHSAWQVDDVDEVGRGAFAMLEEHPERHVWGLGRHHAGSNFFWYLRDPAGNYSEYYADLDEIPEDAAWTPETPEGHLGLYSWGPLPPPEFLNPTDITELAASRRASTT